jgi:hypothetical protein
VFWSIQEEAFNTILWTLVDIFQTSLARYQHLGILDITKFTAEALAAAKKGTFNKYEYYPTRTEDTEILPMPFRCAQQTAMKRPRLDCNEDWTRNRVPSTPQGLPASRIEGWPFSSIELLKEICRGIGMALDNHDRQRGFATEN